jgi:hypothetical protein
MNKAPGFSQNIRKMCINPLPRNVGQLMPCFCEGRMLQKAFSWQCKRFEKFHVFQEKSIFFELLLQINP